MQQKLLKGTPGKAPDLFKKLYFQNDTNKYSEPLSHTEISTGYRDNMPNWCHKQKQGYFTEIYAIRSGLVE